ncbi:hypothetical protein DC498_14070 [Terrimonas sp.]|nr:hypothetical protein DC498_14070 [Terrimonas sp.]
MEYDSAFPIIKGYVLQIDLQLNKRFTFRMTQWSFKQNKLGLLNKVGGFEAFYFCSNKTN